MVMKKDTKKQKKTGDRRKKEAIKNDLMMKDRHIMDESKLEKLVEAALEIQDALDNLETQAPKYCYPSICIRCLNPMSIITSREFTAEDLKEARRHTICQQCIFKESESDEKKGFGHA